MKTAFKFFVDISHGALGLGWSIIPVQFEGNKKTYNVYVVSLLCFHFAVGPEKMNEEELFE